MSLSFQTIPSEPTSLRVMICIYVSTSEAWEFKPLSVTKNSVDFPATYPNWLASFFILYKQTYLIYLGHSCLVSSSLNLVFIFEYFGSMVSHYFNQSTKQLPLAEQNIHYYSDFILGGNLP